jgi:uroporphyrinogen-III synthase
MRRLTILRPEPGASASLALARELGIEADVLPLFKIEPIAWQVPDPAGFDGLLLTSANAVRFAGDGLLTLRGLEVYAVGDATADEARKAGFDIASSGSAGVERLLGSIEGGRKLLHLCGQDRTEVDETRHAITAVPVYRSVQLPRPDGIDSVEVVAVHSPRAARRFAELFEEGDRSAVAVAAISEAAAGAVGGGWNAVVIAQKPDERCLLALAKELCDKPA